MPDGRSTKSVTDTGLPAAVRGRVVLVTGGSGFLGGALVQRLLTDDVAEVRVLTRNANTESVAGMVLGRQPQLIVGSLNDQSSLREAVRGAQVVFHLAAMKSVAFCETNPTEAINTNVVGAGALIQTALSEPGLERFVAISSDKASRPTSVYGLTKALLERMMAEAAGRGNADFGTVRCGSLWGSPGSVLDRWREAGRTRSDLLVTDPEMTRFVMHRPEAVDLILEAASRDLAGAVLCRVMPAYILADLASIMAEILGVKQRVTGAKPGEKLHEDLVSETEAPFTERRGEFFTIMPAGRSSCAEPFSSVNAPRLNRTELSEIVTDLLATSA